MIDSDFNKHLKVTLCFCLILFQVAVCGCSKSPTSPVPGATWVASTLHAPFSGRYGHASAVFNNNMWVIGGAASDSSGSVTYWDGDIWSSPDGAKWTEAIAAAPFGARYSPQVLVYGGKMWLIGGNKGRVFQNDVWNTSDGVNWTQVLPTGPAGPTQFSAREDFGAVVFNNLMWVIGGWDGTSKNDVWSSPDGITWTAATQNAAFKGRWGMGSTVFNNLMWITGGASGGPNPTTAYLDTWSSPDGTNWTQATANAAFANNYYHSLVSYNNQMWLLCGALLTWGAHNYVYGSPNGITWTITGYQNPFQARFYQTSFVFNNAIWIIGGVNNLGGSLTYFNDVWHSP